MISSHIPALLRVGVIFIIIVLLIRKKASLGNTFMIGAVCLSLFFRMNPADLIKSVIYSVLDPKTLGLSAIVSLILILSHIMEISGQMKRLLEKFQGLVSSPRINIIVFPAMIGLLPMPGGAIFSAPMVKQIGENSDYSSDKLSFINYWFRHIWEYWWPLYPGVLLTSVLAGLNLPRFILFMFPLTLLAVGSGYLLLTAGEPRQVDATQDRPKFGPFLSEMSPILIVIFPGLGMGALLSALFPDLPVDKEIGLVLALFAAILWVRHKNSIPNDKMRQVLLSPKLINIIYMVFAILAFKGVLEDSHAVSAISNELMALHIPLFFIVALLPFLVGMVTGITIAFVGSAFPILIPLIQTLDPGGNLLPYMMLGLGSGFAGVMLSPVHLCFILSNEYFETSMGNVYRHLALPCAILAGASMAYYWLLQIFIFKTV